MTIDPRERALPEHISEIENDELIAAMEALAEGESDLEVRKAFYQAFLRSTLILPTMEEASDEAPTAGEEEPEPPSQAEQSQVLAFENDAGEPVLIVFTDEDAFLNWQPEGTSYIGLHALDLLPVAVNSPIAELVVNPAGPVTAHLRRAELVELAKGRTPSGEAETRTMPSGTTVLIEPPDADPPEAWVEALSEILSSYPSIENAYLFKLQMPVRENRVVVGLALYQGMSGSAKDRLVQTMLNEFEDKMPEGGELDFVLLEEEDFLQTVRDTVDPIYAAE